VVSSVGVDHHACDIIVERHLPLSSSIRGFSTPQTRQYLVSDLAGASALVNPPRGALLRSEFNATDDILLLSTIERSTTPKSEAMSSILASSPRLSRVVMW